MEIPRNHDDNNNEKKNTKTMPVAINIGAGGLGIGGIVLVGGALVTATIVSALAFKRRRQRRRSSSENTKKEMSSPSQSPETQPVDAPSDEVTSMKEIQTKNVQSFTPDKKHEMDNEDIIDPVVVQDQGNTCLDSAVECTEEDSCLERDDGDGDGEDQKHLMPIDHENDEHVDANSLVSDEGVMWIEEYEAIEVPVVKDLVAEASKNEDDQETVFMNEVAVMEAVCMDQVKVEDNLHDEIVLDNCEGELSDETGYADQIVHEVVETDELMSKDEETGMQVKVDMTIEHESVKKDEIRYVESVKEDEESEEDDTVKVEVSSDAGSSSMPKEPAQEANITIHKIEETDVQAKLEMITDYELVKKDEIPYVESVKENEESEEGDTVKVELSSDVDSMPKEPVQEANITNHKIEEKDVHVKLEMITDHELVKKDEIRHDKSGKEDVDGEEDATEKAELNSGVSSFSIKEESTPANISFKTEETNVQTKVEMIIDHALVKDDETPLVEFIKEDEESEEDVTVKTNLDSSVNYSSMQEEPTPVAKISNRKIVENMKEDQIILGKNHNGGDNGVKKELMAWFVLISLCCLVASLLFILILLGYRNHSTNLVKFKLKTRNTIP